MPNRVSGIDGDVLAKLILKSLKDLLAQASLSKPMVIVIEDVHWADSSTLEMLESLFGLAEHHRVLFVNVFRPGYEDTSDRLAKIVKEQHAGRLVEIRLQALDAGQSDRLVANLLNIEGFPVHIREQLIERTGGNPFFVEEVVRSLIDEGAVELRRGKFEATEKIESAVIPGSINEVIMARIDRLEEQTKDLLRTAAVIGRNFFHRILSRTAESIDSLDERIGYLEDMQLIRHSRRMQEIEYLFKHALAQEAVYRSILLQKRKQMHLHVARAIESIFSDRMHEFFGMLAYHYSQAEDLEKAEEYLTKAGEAALESSASAEALEYYNEALKLYLKMMGSSADSEKVMMFETNIARAHYNRANYPATIEHVDRALISIGEKSPGKNFSFLLRTFFSLPYIVLFTYLGFKKKNRIPNKIEETRIQLYITKAYSLGVVDPELFVVNVINLTKIILKYDVDKIARGMEAACGLGVGFAIRGFFSFGRRLIETLTAQYHGTALQREGSLM